MDNIEDFEFEIFDNNYKTDNFVIPNNQYEKINDHAFENFINVKHFELPKFTYSIGDYAFANCFSLEKVEIPNSCLEIGKGCFSNCTALKDIEFLSYTRRVPKIGDYAFFGCNSLTDLYIPDGLTRLGAYAFAECDNLWRIYLPTSLDNLKNNTLEGCKNLKHVDLPQSLTSMGEYCFANCSSLKKINLKGTQIIKDCAFKDCISLETLEYGIRAREVGYSVFEGCFSLTSVTFNERLENLGQNVFKDCTNLKEAKLNGKISLLPLGLFSNCVNLKNVELPSSVNTISNMAFFNCKSLESIDLKGIETIGFESFRGCKSLKQIEIPESVEFIGDTSFDDCGFKYFYKLKNSNSVFISKKLPENQNEIYRSFSIDDLKNVIIDFDFSSFCYNETFDVLCNYYDIITKNKINIPNDMFFELVAQNNTNDFFNTCNLKFFNNEIGEKGFNKIKNLSAEDKNLFYKFAYSLGCFSNEILVDKNNLKSNIKVGQKASSLLGSILNNEKYDIHTILKYVTNITLKESINSNFLNFISIRGKNKNLDNFDMLLNLEKEYPNIMTKVMLNFNDAEKLLIGINKDGTTFKRSWENVFKEFYFVNEYKNVTNDNLYIAKIFLEKRVDEQAFEYACKIFKEAKEKNIRPHILDIPLNEKTTINSIEEIQNDTEAILVDCKDKLDTLHKNKFTYEMFDKSRPENAIIGMYCSCCASLTSIYYGKKIAESTINENNVQNMVIRDNNNNIVAKGTIYVNEKLGYGVINDFEINEKYKAHEDKLKPGHYDNTKSPQDVADRKAIFDTFMRGIKAFAKEYDKEHPDKPLQQVNVGMKYNRLSEICDKFPIENNKLNVPDKYRFDDAEYEQRILYKKDDLALTKN